MNSKKWLSLFLTFTIFASFAVGQSQIPSSEDSINELVAAGVSETAAAGIVKFDAKFMEPFELEKSNPIAAKESIDEIHEEFNDYIQSLSLQDQSAYQKYIKNKHSQFL